MKHEKISRTAIKILRNAREDSPLTACLPECRTPGGFTAVLLSLRERGLLTRDGVITPAGMAVLATIENTHTDAAPAASQLTLEV